jgi:protein involved in polysaccharide export with SLBB domain
MRYKYFLYIIFCLLISVIQLHAQTLSLENIQNVKVDDLSDDQILMLYQKLQSSGVSEENAYQMIQQKGLPSIEVDKLKKRIASIKSGAKSNTLIKVKTKPDSISYSRQEQNIPLTTFTNIPSQVYGLSYFNNSKLSFQPDLRIATPEGYVIGPDDELIVLITGLNESSLKTKVTPEGNIQIPYVGLIYVSGLTIEQARIQIKSKMQRFYPALSSGQTKLSVTLGNIRSIRVTIIGEVKQPGTYTLSSLSTMFNALYQTGGPTENGSLRSIELIRGSKVIKTVDLYSFLQKGLLSDNVRLQDQDVIRIPFYQKRVVLSGEVKLPAAYELKQGETISDLIQYAGGFSPDAYQQMVKVFQKGKMERMVKNVPDNIYENYVPQNADSVVVGRILDRYANRVSIYGAVYRPGVFELRNGLTLKGLIHDASGLKDDALLNRGYINRIKPDLTKQTVSFDLADIMSGKIFDIALQREDEVFILSSDELQNELLVSISGFVKQPGNYSFREGMQLADLIAMAGGFKYNAANHRIEISRIIQNKSDSVANQLVKTFTVDLNSNLQSNNPIPLQALDKITVPRLVNYQTLGDISMGGEVLFPGIYALQRRDETALELIERAGGITPSGSLKNAQIYRNGLRVDANLTGKEKERKLILLPQDSVFIPKENPFVEVVGGVNTPQLFHYNIKNFKYYINSAGGIKQNVKLRNAYIAYPNGINSPVKHFLFFRNYPIVIEGSKIIVPPPSFDVKVKLGVGEISAFATALTALVSIFAILRK